MKDRMKEFQAFREEYPELIYENGRYKLYDNRLEIVYDFRIPGLAEFHPTWTIARSGGAEIDKAKLDELVFSLGMVELVSYWKAACPPRVRVLKRSLAEEQIQWWKKLYFNGLGEFFYTNHIQTGDDFMEIICADGAEPTRKPQAVPTPNRDLPRVLIPVGGGKDSAVTIELLKDAAERTCYIINPRQATRDTVKTAGLEDSTIIARRTIDPALLELNRRGFLNGHTPFSAVVAFSSVLAAYLNGLDDVALSNESSANESTVAGSAVNHQYSKSFEFEWDFIEYERAYIGTGVHYFSLLRPLSELQIARLFSGLKQYHPVFRSCNAGSKTDTWCGSCPKCLFVAIILSPFLTEQELTAIFQKNMLDDWNRKEDFDKLTGLLPEKPFECVGSRDEVHAALQMTLDRRRKAGEPLPALLRYYAEKFSDGRETVDYDARFDEEHALPSRFVPLMKRAAGVRED